MKLAIMQPYFFPYIGYFQLMASVDTFVVYDNIKYTKKGWINRNRIQNRGVEGLISLPLKKGSDYLDVRQRELSDTFDREKLCNQIAGAYRQAPFYRDVMPLIERIVKQESCNLFDYLFQGLVTLRDYFSLDCELLVSSAIDAEHTLKAQDRVLELCRVLKAETYINPPGGVALYSQRDFNVNGIVLKFIQPRSWLYKQSGAAFIPWLSIVDVMMFNARDEIIHHLKTGYELN